MITTLPPTAPVADVLGVLDHDGVAIVDRLIPTPTMDLLMLQLEPHLDEQRPGGGPFFGHQAKRLSSVITLAPSFGDVLTNATLLGVADGVLGANCDSFQVQLTAALEVWPDGTEQPLHRDEGVYGAYLPMQTGHPEYMITFMLAGTDFTPDNGATRLVVGSHGWEPEREAKVGEVSQAAMARGSVAIWFGSVLHGMGVNRSMEPRTGITGGYSVGWLRQEENQYLACPEAVAQTLPDAVQQLLGYRAHSPILGWVGGRDPDLLTATKADDDGAAYSTIASS